MTFIGLMAIVGFLTVAYLLSFPVVWVLDQTFGRFGLWAMRKRAEWDAAYRD